MTRIVHSLIWAAAILVAALISSANGLGDGASTAIFMGLSGAALAPLHNPGTCGGRAGCAQ